MILKVDENLYRGPYTDPAVLKAAGIKNVVCLQTPEDRILDGPYSEDLLGNGSGIKIWHHPLSDIFFPGDNDLADLRWMIAALRLDGPLFVHCTRGVDRTGIVCAFHRVVVQRWPIDAAIEEMRNLGFHEFPYFWWIPQFRKMLKRFGK